jgi:hypothetical protein
MTSTEMYQAEIARRSKDGVPDDEQPSLLSEAVSRPTFSKPAGGFPRFWRATIKPKGFARSEHKPLANPPALSEFLFSLFGPKDRTDSLLGDLEELFHIDLQSVGEKRARWRYRSRAWRSLAPLIFNKLKNWRFFAFFFEICRRKIGW